MAPTSGTRTHADPPTHAPPLPRAPSPASPPTVRCLAPPCSALFHAVIDAGELGAAMLHPGGAQQLLGWTRRVVAAAIDLKARLAAEQ